MQGSPGALAPGARERPGVRKRPVCLELPTVAWRSGYHGPTRRRQGMYLRIHICRSLDPLPIRRATLGESPHIVTKENELIASRRERDRKRIAHRLRAPAPD